jgi:hypothetical protein
VKSVVSWIIVGFKQCSLIVRDKCLVLVLHMCAVNMALHVLFYSLTKYKMVPTKFSSVKWGINSNLHTSTNLRAIFMANSVELLEEMCFCSLNYKQV